MSKNNLTQAQQKAALKTLDKGESTLAEVLTDTFVPKSSGQHVEAPTKLRVATLTEAHKKALAALADVYGSVTPEVPRMLTDDELEAIVDEQVVVSTLLTLLKGRKDNSIREALAYHLDKVALAEGLASEGDVTDKNGHYYVKQDLSVEGTGKKVQRIVSDPAPRVSSQLLLDLHEAGDLTRAEYLALTSKPPVDRVFDEAKARAAIRKDPALLAKVAQAVERVNPTITIKVADDK